MHVLLNVTVFSLILFSSTMTGFAIARNYVQRPRQLQDLVTALQLLLTEIVYSATPLPEALRSCARTVSNPIRQFLLQVSGLLDKMHTAQTAWETAMGELQQKSALLQSDLEALHSLGAVLGISNREDQQRHLALSIKRLEALHISAQSECNQNERLWKYLGVMVGVVIVIILV